MKFRKFLNLAILLLLAVGVEAGLLALAHWQFHRYHQRLNAIHAFAVLPPVTLHGTFANAQTVALVNQPNPSDPDAPTGWRILTPLNTESGTVIVDRGWAPPAADPNTGAPHFTSFATSATQVGGVWQPFPHRRGWLRGPDTTTSPRLLLFLNPARIVSESAPQYLVAATPTAAAITPVPPPLTSPLRHLSYMWQWLGMAVAFPLLCWSVLRKKKRKARA